MKTMFGGRRAGSAAGTAEQAVTTSDNTTARRLRGMAPPSLRFPRRQEELDDVREVLFAQLLFHLVRHERLAGSLHGFNLRPQDRVLGSLGPAEGDARGRLGGEHAGELTAARRRHLVIHV